MGEQNAQTELRGPGATLASARERASLTIAQVAAQLHLDVDSLQALEANRLGVFGAAVFARGHLRRYGELLGIPVSEIDAAYAACSEAPTPAPDLHRSAAPLVETGRKAVPLPPGILVVGTMLLILVALVWWAQRTPPRAPAISGVRSVTSAAPAATPRQSFSSTVRSGSATSAAASGLPAGSPASALPAVATPSTVQLGLMFSQDCWTEVYDSGGTRLLYHLVTAGSVRHLSGVAPLRILLGNPAGVTLQLNSRAVTLSNAARSAPLRFTLYADGHLVHVRVWTVPPKPPGSVATPER
ncbi:MAG: helix-turn-helix domain-containing protein [Steroidobacteraceae bacterium]